jgi:hypothetical protein
LDRNEADVIAFNLNWSLIMNEAKVKVMCDVFWAQTHKINEMSGKYQINLCNLSDAAVKALEEMGVTVAQGEENKASMGRYITCKSNNPIRVWDADGMEIPADVMIGNGSKGKALVGSYEWKYKNKKGISPSLKRLIVTDLVAYGNNGDEIDDEDVL